MQFKPGVQPHRGFGAYCAVPPTCCRWQFSPKGPSNYGDFHLVGRRINLYRFHPLHTGDMIRA